MTKMLTSLIELEKEQDFIGSFSSGTGNSWLYIKNIIGMNFVEEGRVENIRVRNIFDIHALLSVCYSMFFLIKAIFKFNDVAFFGATTSLINIKGKFVDSNFPFKLEQYESTTRFMHIGNMSSFTKKQQLDCNIIALNLLVKPLQIIFCKMLWRFIPLNKHLYCTKMLNEICEINLPSNFLKQKHSEYVIGVFLYKLLFSFFRFKKAYVVSAYTKADMVGALKCLNVLVIEVQHGIIGRSHLGYVSALTCSFRKKYYIDRIAVYNDYWQRELLTYTNFETGDIDIIGRVKYESALERQQVPFENYIIYTSQTMFDSALKKFFIEANKYLMVTHTKLIYVPHPKEDCFDIASVCEFFKELPCIRVYRGSISTESLIKYSIAHVSIDSACHFDAIHFNKISFALNISSPNAVTDYLNDMDLILINDLSEVFDYVS